MRRFIVELYKIFLITLANIITLSSLANSKDVKTDIVTSKKEELQVDTPDYFAEYKSRWNAVEDSLKKKALQDDANALYELGMYYMRENSAKSTAYSMDRNSVEFAYLTKAVGLGHLDAISLLAKSYYLPKAKDGLEQMAANQMMVEWRRVVTLKAKNGDAKSQNDLGWDLLEKDFSSKEAREWFRKSALQNYAEGQWNYALFGPENERDYWLAEAAQNGCSVELYRLGKSEEEKGNYTKAISLYRKVCMKEPFGFYAHLALADMYYYGRGVQQNYKVAVSWYEYIAMFAGTSEVVKACLRLSACCRFGRGVVQNEKQADQWFAKAQEYAKRYTEEEEAKNIGSVDFH